MIRKTLGKLLTRIGKLLADKPDDEHHSPTERWLRKMKADFKKQRLINPSTGKLDLRFNPLSNDEHICGPYGLSDETLDGDNKQLDMTFNPLNGEDFCIPHVA